MLPSRRPSSGNAIERCNGTMRRSDYTYSINHCIRNLLLGRVLLKADVEENQVLIPVGQEFHIPFEGLSVPGTRLWFGGPYTAKIVEPSSDDTPSGIDHEESVTLIPPQFNSLHAVIESPLQNSYNSSAGAYLAIDPIPTVSQGLKFIEEDFIDSWQPSPPNDDVFPCVIVNSSGMTRQPLSNTSWEDQYSIIIRYMTTMPDGYKRDDMKSEVEELANVLHRDNYLGGSSYNSQMEGIRFCSTPGMKENRGILTAKGIRVDWADILLTAWRVETYIP